MSLRLGYKNLIRDATVIGKTSENPQFPAENTQDDILALPWRATGCGDEHVDYDLGQAREYDLVGILSHNLSPSATVSIIGADDSAFSTGVVTDALTWHAGLIVAFLGTARTKRYVRLRVQDPSNTDGFVEIGTPILYKYAELNRTFTVGYREGEDDQSQVDMSPSMNLFTVQERVPVINRVLPFEGLDTASIATVRALLAECGVHKAWLFCTDSNDPNHASYWVRLKDISLPEYQHVSYWNWEANTEEVL